MVRSSRRRPMARKHSRRDFIQTTGAAAGVWFASGAGVSGEETGAAGAVGSPPQSPGSMGARFRALLARPEPLLSPAAYDVISARLIEHEGFEAVTVSGSSTAASRIGMPDFGLITITELVDAAGAIAERVGVPVMADADDGGGSPLNVYRATRAFEERGVAAVMYEDTPQVKHLTRGGGDLIPAELMAEKVRAAVEARRDPDTVVIARNDSLSVGSSMAEALERGRLYAEAGADVLFFAGLGLDDIAGVRQELGRPLMSTVNARSVTPERLRTAGVDFAVYTQLFGIGLGAMAGALRELRETGLMAESAELSLSGDVSRALTRSEEMVELGRRYGLAD
jgi:2-methylisocitrate lyase-like PEP mutase family enzyme